MARIVGADTAYPVTKALIAQATKVMGAPPSFWGRYFTSTQTTGVVEYRHAVENSVLAEQGIRVLPIARQTDNVGRDRASGYSDGVANGADLIATFGEDYLAGQGPGVCVFLDVEGSGPSHLSSDYYAGWVDGLGSASTEVTFLPCVYGIPGDAVTWTALARAISAGAACQGLWVAHPLVKTAEPVAWRPHAVAPSPDPGVPVLLWQYMFSVKGAALDRSQVNPAIDAQNDLLQYLVLPPGAAPVAPSDAIAKAVAAGAGPVARS
jgi:hypothetical protein